MKTKDLRKLATDIYNKHFDKYIDNPDKNRDFLIDAMLSFHEQASKDMYPKEFVEWKDENYYYSLEIYWKRVKTMIDITKVKKFYSLDELYQYYLTNIKNK